MEHRLVVAEVIRIRQNHRHIGCRKLYELLQSFLLEHKIKIGRDGLFSLLSENNLLVRVRKRRVNTTNSYHHYHKYKNLIKGFTPNSINQLWVSDITYWKIKSGFVYISFITDAYSHKIVGYNVAETMEAIESVLALKMALKNVLNKPEKLFHHSDRGVQYCSTEYIKILKQNDIEISMTESGDPLDNAIAERINGIIKNEYLNDYEVITINEAKELLNIVVELYNNERPHMSNGNIPPNTIHTKKLKTEKLWKNYYRKNINIVNPLQDEILTVNK